MGYVLLGIMMLSLCASVIILAVLLIISVFDKLLKNFVLCYCIICILFVCCRHYFLHDGWDVAVVFAGPVLLFLEICTLTVYGTIKFVRWWKKRKLMKVEFKEIFED